MKPEKNQHVKCVLKNNAVIEGIVEKWDSTEIILKSLNSKSVIIIHAGVSDIMFTKIVLEEEVVTNSENIKEAISSKIQETLQISNEQVDLKTKSLQELVLLKQEHERQIITEKLKDHNLTEVKKVTYGTPRFFQK